MQRFNVPIYVANITIEIKEKSGKITTVTRKRKFPDIIVKGFSIADIISRKSEFYREKLNLGAKESMGNIEIELLSQHGYGIDD